MLTLQLPTFASFPEYSEGIVCQCVIGRQTLPCYPRYDIFLLGCLPNVHVGLQVLVIFETKDIPTALKRQIQSDDMNMKTITEVQTTYGIKSKGHNQFTFKFRKIIVPRWHSILKCCLWILTLLKIEIWSHFYASLSGQT